MCMYLLILVFQVFYSVPDYYIDLDGNKVNGEIKYLNANKIIFRDPISFEETELTPFDILSFRTENRDYIILDSLTIKSRVLLIKKNYPKAFVEEVSIGKLKLYKLDHVLKGWATEWYYYIQKPNEKLIQVPVSSNKTFREFMYAMMKDSSKMVDYYKKEKWKIRDLRALVAMYNTQ